MENYSQDINKIFGNDKQAKQKLKKLEMKEKKESTLINCYLIGFFNVKQNRALGALGENSVFRCSMLDVSLTATATVGGK